METVFLWTQTVSTLSYLKILHCFTVFFLVSRWRFYRKLLQQRFSLKILSGFVSIFEEKSLIFCKQLETKAGKESFDVYDFTELFTLDCIFGMTF